MSIITIILSTIVAIEHLYIMYMETIVTDSDLTSRAFGISKEILSQETVKKCFKNQGVYNGLLALMLLYGIYFSRGEKEIVILSLIFVVSASLYGGITVNRKILLKQGGPAILALISMVLF